MLASGWLVAVAHGRRAPRRSRSPARSWPPASFATNGHTRVGSTVALATIADVTHLLVAAAWGGGLVLLGATPARPPADEDDRADTITLVGRFSNLATVTVVLVGRQRHRPGAGARCGTLDALTEHRATAGCCW